MIDKTHLPCDVARCWGVTQDGAPISPCNSCDRFLFRLQCGERQSWIDSHVKYDGRCFHYLPSPNAGETTA